MTRFEEESTQPLLSVSFSDTPHTKSFISKDYEDSPIYADPNSIAGVSINAGSMTMTTEKLSGEKGNSLSEIEHQPTDARKLVLIMMIVVGISTLFPSSALIASSDYYEAMWEGSRGKSLLFIAPLLIQVTTPFIQILLTKYQDRITYTSRMIVCLVLNSILAVILPIIVKIFPSTTSYICVLGIILFVGFNNSILKCTAMALSAMFPPVYTQFFIIGQAASPFIVIVLKVIIKLVYPGTSMIDGIKVKNMNNIQFGALIFFMSSAFFTLFGAVIYKVARRSIFSRHYFPSFKRRLLLIQEQRRQQQEYDEYLRNKAAAATIRDGIEEDAQDAFESGSPLHPSSSTAIHQPIPSITSPPRNDQRQHLLATSMGTIHHYSDQHTDYNADHIQYQCDLEGIAGHNAAVAANAIDDDDIFTAQEYHDIEQLAQSTHMLDVMSLNGSYFTSDHPDDDAIVGTDDIDAHITPVDAIELLSVMIPPKVNKFHVFLKLKIPIIQLVVALSTSCMIYPGLFGRLTNTWSWMDRDWFILTCLLIFCAVDFAVRMIPNVWVNKILYGHRLNALIGVRTIIYPIMWCMAYLSYKSLHNSTVVTILNIILAATHSLVLVAVLTNYQRLIAPEEKNSAGAIMAVGVASGVLIGFLLSTCMDLAAQHIFHLVD